MRVRECQLLPQQAPPCHSGDRSQIKTTAVRKSRQRPCESGRAALARRSPTRLPAGGLPKRWVTPTQHGWVGRPLWRSPAPRTHRSPMVAAPGHVPPGLQHLHGLRCHNHSRPPGGVYSKKNVSALHYCRFGCVTTPQTHTKAAGAGGFLGVLLQTGTATTLAIHWHLLCPVPAPTVSGAQRW